MRRSFSARSRLNPPAGHANFAQQLTDLSVASVHRNFDPYLDIDWDAPEFRVFANDPRWVLHPVHDPIGRHPWYQAQPLDTQIQIGMWRQANITKVGLQFETILIGGFMSYMFVQLNGAPEFRYAAHEAREECNHIMMFQEFVNRVDPSVTGPAFWFKAIARFIPVAGSMMPLVFFIGVLAGEEPIDHFQKQFLRSEDSLHPLLTAIFKIHVAEEARHIAFAHEWLKLQVPHRGWFPRMLLSIMYPLTMRLLMGAIMVPPRTFFKKFGIPDEVRKDIYWRSPESQELRREILADVRMLGEECNLMNPVSRRVWKLLRLDGRASRHRSEPAYGPRIAA